MRASSRRFSSGKGTAGRATSEVSSRKMRVLLKGIAYRNVGSRLRAQSSNVTHVHGGIFGYDTTATQTLLPVKPNSFASAKDVHASVIPKEHCSIWVSDQYEHDCPHLQDNAAQMCKPCTLHLEYMRVSC